MKKMIPLIFAVVFVLNSFSAIGNCMNLKSNSQVNEEASKLFVNYDEKKDLYQTTNMSSIPTFETFDYVIITTSDLYQSIISSYFLDWKSYVGYHPKIVNITDKLIIEQSGNDLAEKIRNFLREYYIDWGIKYVLIVGNYDTVPMRYCYPNPYNHEFNLSDVFGGEFPTDYYYADLSYADNESWDSDGDGFYGEYKHDNPDFLAEVSVGRITTNDADGVVYTLEKLLAFEMDTGEWKNNALDAGAIIMFEPDFLDGAASIDDIESQLMSGMTISHYSEQEGIKISEYKWKPLKEEAFTCDWASGKYGIVNWFAHGWSNVAIRLVWISDDDGDGRADDEELVSKDIVSSDSSLDDDYPSIVFAASCLIGYPEPCPDEWPDNRRGNLGVDLLTKPSFGASVGIISATRVTFISPQCGIDDICYEFNKNLFINHESVGDAFYNAKIYCHENCPVPGYYEYWNMFGYNLYGDPSLVYEGITAEGKPERPIVSGPVSGKVGEEYTYSAISDDPDNDNLYFLFNWGDGTNSGWLGPSESGEEYNASHAWSEKGNYEVKVRVKDVNGLISEWSDPLSVSMPRNKAINRPFLNFLQNHPYIFQILRLLLQRLGL